MVEKLLTQSLTFKAMIRPSRLPLISASVNSKNCDRLRKYHLGNNVLFQPPSAPRFSIPPAFPVWSNIADAIPPEIF